MEGDGEVAVLVEGDECGMETIRAAKSGTARSSIMSRVSPYIDDDGEDDDDCDEVSVGEDGDRPE